MTSTSDLSRGRSSPCWSVLLAMPPRHPPTGRCIPREVKISHGGSRRPRPAPTRPGQPAIRPRRALRTFDPGGELTADRPGAPDPAALALDAGTRSKPQESNGDGSESSPLKRSACSESRPPITRVDLLRRSSGWPGRFRGPASARTRLAAALGAPLGSPRLPLSGSRSSVNPNLRFRPAEPIGREEPDARRRGQPHYPKGLLGASAERKLVPRRHCGLSIVRTSQNARIGHPVRREQRHLVRRSPAGAGRCCHGMESLRFLPPSDDGFQTPGGLLTDPQLVS